MQKKEKITCNTKLLIGLFGFDISSTHFVWHVLAHCVAGKLASVFPLSKFNFWPSTLFSSLFKFYFVGPKCCFLSCLEVCDPIFSRTVGGFWNLSHNLLKARLSCQLGMFQKYCNPQPLVARASIGDRQLNKTHANLVFGVVLSNLLGFWDGFSPLLRLQRCFFKFLEVFVRSNTSVFKDITLVFWFKISHSSQIRFKFPHPGHGRRSNGYELAGRECWSFDRPVH